MMLLTYVRGEVAVGTEDVMFVTLNQPFFIFLDRNYGISGARSDRENCNATRLMDLGQVGLRAS